MFIKTLFPEISCQFPPNDNEIIQLKQWYDEVQQKKIDVRSHLRLFVHEAIQHMKEEEFEILVQLFANKRRDAVDLFFEDAKRRAKLEGKNEEQAQAQVQRTIKGDMFKFISYSEHPNALPYLLAIIARCKNVDPDAFAELHLNGLATVDYYARLFSVQDEYKMDRISGVLEPEWIIKYFKSRNISEYDPLLKRIELLYIPHKPGRKEIDAAACLFVRGLVHCTDGVTRTPNSTREIGDWYYDFLEACLTHAQTRFLPRFIDPDYKDDLDCYRAKKIIGPAMLVDNTELLQSFIDDVQSNKPRSQHDYIRYRFCTAHIEYEPASYILRPYQNELVLHANSGKNTIICAPTGCGKTLLAVDIIKNHLERQHRDGKVGRCVMLVPTVPLVDQQALHFVTYLGAYKDYGRPDLPYWIDGFSGCENVSDGRANRLLACDICVMTPQILINMMNSILRSERVYFADFSMIIFDECHHCDQRHPYKILMEMLENAGMEEVHQRPQIVGLTASMGVGDTSINIEICKQHMLTLCLNLMAETISTVRHQLENLKSHVMPPVDVVCKVQRPKVDPFFECIDKLMTKIEKQMYAELEKLIATEELRITMDQINFPPHTDQSRYQTMVGTLKKHVQRVRHNIDLRFLLVRSIDHLSHYFHAILLSDLLPNSYALEYLDEKMSNYNKSQSSLSNADSGAISKINMNLLNNYQDLRKRLADIEKKNLNGKEILGKLHSILRNQFDTEPDSRCLIFVATRNCARKLATHLMNVPELPMLFQKQNVGFMVSSNQSCSAAGQSSLEQQQMRNDFDSGRIKVMVVTSVAEEGVNITACNLIIKYNNVGSERSMIQRRGRARQKNSRSILLALDNYIEKAEYINMQKEALMMRCIEDLKEQSESSLKQSIMRKRQELAQIRERDSKIKEQKRNLLNGRRYKLSCRSCSNLVSSSTNIRCITDTIFVVCDISIWKRSKMEVRIQASKDQLTTRCARWLCGKCNTQEWGTVIKYSNVYLPQLNANAFTMKREDATDVIEDITGNRRTWKRVQEEFFNVDPINLKNIKEMYSALKTAMPELINQMDTNEVIANQKFLEKMKEKTHERKNRIQLFLDE